MKKTRGSLGLEEKVAVLPTWISEAVEHWFDKDYRSTFYERIECLLDSEPLYLDLPYPQRYGKTLAYTLERISVFINPRETIVGSVREIVPTREQYERADALSRKWWDIAPEDIQPKALWFYSYGWLKRRPPWFLSFGHLALDWQGIVTRGLGSFASRAREFAGRPEAKADEARRNFLEGAVICCEALACFIRRYAAEARREATRATGTEREKELLRIADSCEWVSEKPARGFAEALQLIWLITLPLMKVCGCGVFNFSRMDQYLLPFYRRDIDTGALSREGALLLLQQFFHKNNEIMSPVDHMSQETEAVRYQLEVTYDDPNYIILGGLLPGDRPGVNELTHLFVEAAHSLRLRNPFIVLRAYPGIEPGFWLKTVAAMRDNTTIIIYNDRTMLPAFRACGVSERDSYDYGLYGCNDPNIPAKEGGLRQLWFNLLRPFELALNSGDFPMEPRAAKVGARESQFPLEDRMIGLMKGPYYGAQTAAPEEMRSMADLLEAYRQQVRFLLGDYRAAIEKDIAREHAWNAGRIRIEDIFLEGTVENGITWNDGGTPYHKITVQGSGLASVIDCFAAVEKLVFRDRERSLAELARILREDWSGNESLRQKMSMRMPKFGNGIAWVDELGRVIVDIFCDEVAACNSSASLYSFFPCISTDRDFTTMGLGVGATPDGRRAGQQISENCSPSEGMDTSGFTALLSSVSRLPFGRITGGPLNVKLHPSAVEGEEGLAALAAALQTYFEQGGMSLMMNVVSRQQLQDAKEHPRRYKSLCVRVTGYSAYFVQMGSKAQNEMIRRTEER